MFARSGLWGGVFLILLNQFLLRFFRVNAYALRVSFFSTFDCLFQMLMRFLTMFIGANQGRARAKKNQTRQ